MNGKRKKELRRELTKLLNRGPVKQGERAPFYDHLGLRRGEGIIPKDEFRAYKKAHKSTTREIGRRKR